MSKYKNYIIVGLIIMTFMVSICFIPIRVSKLIPIFEEQIEKDLGVKVHIERLILRLGPTLKVKAPIMHLMFADGEKFAQFDNVKFYVTWKSLLKNDPVLQTIQSKKLTVRVFSDCKHYVDFLNKINERDFNEIPEIKLKEYSYTYFNKENSEKYIIKGQDLVLSKVPGFKSFKLKTIGDFSINNQKFINYDLTILPNLNILECSLPNDLIGYIEQIKDLDFHSDIRADLKLYKNQQNFLQASGSINIDNISVLDRAKKNPKSFVYLTFWGDKASILSNIYTSINKKVYIEGMINNSQKPVLDIKVKTDDIEIEDLYKKLQFFANFSQLKNIESIKGKLNANFNLKGDLNKIKSNGFMSITDAVIKSNGVNIEKINANIDFSNNSINIVNAVGYVNNSPIIAKGYLNKELNLEILMNKVELKSMIPSNYGIKKGLASLIANIQGPLNNITHKENLLVENLEIANDHFDLDLESFKINTNESSTAYIQNVLCKTKETEQIKIPSLKLTISPDKIHIPETSIFMPNSKLTIKGDILDYNNKNFNFVTNIEGFLNSKDFIRLKNYSSRYPLRCIFSGNKLQQLVNAQVAIEKTDVFDEPTMVNLNARLDKNSLKIEDLSLNTYSGKLTDEVKNNTKASKKVILTGTIDNIKTPVLKNTRIFIPQPLNINIYDTLAQIKGDIFVSGNIVKPEIIGQLSVQNLFNQQMQLSLSNATFDFNKNNIMLNSPQTKISDSTMGINALISTDISKAFTIKNMTIKSKYLNTDTLLMYKDSPVLNLYPISVQDGKFYSERVFANVYGSPLYLSAFTSDFKLDKENLIIKNIVSELFNGKMTGEVVYNLHDEHFDAKIMTRGVSAEPIFNVISPRKDSISGTMDFDANLKGELTSKQSLNGNIKFVVNNGRMSTLGKIEHLLYAQNVIADNMLRTSLSVVTKALTLKDTGLFKYLRGDIDLENGIANIKMLQSQGPLMSLFIKGQYNPMNNNAKLIVLGRLSDEIITGLGAFGDFSLKKLMIMLTGEDEKQPVLPEDYDKIPQLPMKNTKEFRSIINGNIDKPASVILFNWISYSEKTLKQKEVPLTETKIPGFVEALPY